MTRPDLLISSYLASAIFLSIAASFLFFHALLVHMAPYSNRKNEHVKPKNAKYMEGKVKSFAMFWYDSPSSLKTVVYEIVKWQPM